MHRIISPALINQLDSGDCVALCDLKICLFCFALLYYLVETGNWLSSASIQLSVCWSRVQHKAFVSHISNPMLSEPHVQPFAHFEHPTSIIHDFSKLLALIKEINFDYYKQFYDFFRLAKICQTTPVNQLSKARI